MLLVDRVVESIFVDVDEAKAAAFNDPCFAGIVGTEMVQEIALRRRVREIPHVKSLCSHVYPWAQVAPRECDPVGVSCDRPDSPIQGLDKHTDVQEQGATLSETIKLYQYFPPIPKVKLRNRQRPPAIVKLVQNHLAVIGDGRVCFRGRLFGKGDHFHARRAGRFDSGDGIFEGKNRIGGDA